MKIKTKTLSILFSLILLSLFSASSTVVAKEKSKQEIVPFAVINTYTYLSSYEQTYSTLSNQFYQSDYGYTEVNVPKGKGIELTEWKRTVKSWSIFNITYKYSRTHRFY